MSLVSILMLVATAYLIWVNVRAVISFTINDRMEGSYIWAPTGQTFEFRVYDPDTGWVVFDAEEKSYKMKYDNYLKYVESGILKRVEE